MLANKSIFYSFINIFLGFTFTANPSQASSKDEAIRIFTSELILSFKIERRFPDPTEFDAPYPPKGGYRTQFEFDLNQDGVPELFLQSSLSNSHAHLGSSNIYDVANHRPRLMAENIQIGAGFGLIHKDSHLILTTVGGTTRHGMGFVRRFFEFHPTGELTQRE